MTRHEEQYSQVLEGKIVRLVTLSEAIFPSDISRVSETDFRIAQEELVLHRKDLNSYRMSIARSGLIEVGIEKQLGNTGVVSVRKRGSLQREERWWYIS